MTAKGVSKPQRQWKMSEISLLRQLSDKSTPYIEMSKQLNRSIPSIQHGVRKFCDKKPLISLTDEQRQKVNQLRAENIAWWRIADELGFSTTTLRKQFGL
jgi:IS30 family transposase